MMAFTDRLRAIGRKLFGKGAQKKKAEVEAKKHLRIKGMRMRKKKRKRIEASGGGWGGGSIVRTSHTAHRRYRKILRLFHVSGWEK